MTTVGSIMGNWIEAQYREASGKERLAVDEVAKVLVDLKARINGDFYIIEVNEERIVLGNRRCPFGEMVRDRPSLCMMTSNVFGRVTAENLGYARVELRETIASGAPGCHVIVHLVPDTGQGRDYYSIRQIPASD